MPDYKLLSGTKGAAFIDFTFAKRASEDATPGTAVSAKCFTRTMNIRLVRGFNPPMVTFCDDNEGWVEQIPGFKSGQFALGAYMSIGGELSNPLSLIDENFALSMAGTFANGCSYNFDGFTDLDDDAIEARGNSARQITGVMTGKPDTTWVEV